MPFAEAVTINLWMFVVLGVLAGILSGMLGVGGGVLLVPALVMVFGFTQKSAQGTSLAVMVPMALVGAWRYAANPTIDLHLGRIALIAAGACAGATIGATIAILLPAAVLRRIFAIFLLVVAVRMLLPRAPAKPGSDSGAVPESPQDAP